MPAWRMSRLDPPLALREGTRSMTSGRRQHRLNNALVVAETAIGLVLLIGAGLLIHSFLRVLNVDPGFDPRHVLTARMDLPENQYPELKRVQFYDELAATRRGAARRAIGVLRLSHTAFGKQHRPLLCH